MDKAIRPLRVGFILTNNFTLTALSIFVDVLRLAALAHSLVAFVLILAIMVHIYAGIWINGTLGAMLHGYVTPGWARKHHPRWFRSIIKSQDLK